MSETKQNKGNQYAQKGETFAENVLDKNVKQPAQNNPSESVRR
ncbi:hypothetical protein ABEV74_06870 [Paenibacillus cisolokensis]|uniref:Spore protein n=1 Tax=Paenibacillus cisolokensis TaxID=1658519 RepID=A0ABQ4N2I8_9BACL|nr:hypothetical protein [Paenibacillus cisolokensis]GIQ62389.1 hypothetical protein PACILC2_09570 [Paenibacillus cisolokensis]